MDYGFFYEIAKYGDEAWKCCSTPQEIAENAYIFKVAWDSTKETGKIANEIQSLLENLKEDAKEGNEVAQEYIDILESEL